MTIKYPLRARRGISGVWIEDGAGVSVCDFNPLSVRENPDLIFDLAEQMACAYNRLKEPDQTPWTDALREQFKKEQK